MQCARVPAQAYICSGREEVVMLLGTADGIHSESLHRDP